MGQENTGKFAILSRKEVLMEWNYFINSSFKFEVDQEKFQQLEKYIKILKSKDSTLEAYFDIFEIKKLEDGDYFADIYIAVLATKLSLEEVKQVIPTQQQQYYVGKVKAGSLDNISYYIDYAGRRFSYSDVKERFEHQGISVDFNF